MARHRSQQRSWPWTIAASVLLFAVAAVAWVDHISDRGVMVAQNVSFNGADISGLSAPEAVDVVSARQEQVLSTLIYIDTGAGQAGFEAADLGFGYASSSVIGSMMSARHHGGPFSRFVSWVTSPLAPVELTDAVTFDRPRARQALSGDERLVPLDPIEPEITSDGADHLYVKPGEPGSALDVDYLVDRLGAATITDGAVRLAGLRVAAPPSVADSVAKDVAAELNELTSQGLEVLVGWSQAILTPLRVREHIEGKANDGVVDVTIDPAGLHAELERTLTRPVGPPIHPVFDVVDDEVAIVSEGEPPPVCCDPHSVEKVAESLLDGAVGPFRIEPRPSTEPDHITWADGSTVKEKVSEFTTMFPCCQSRVTNIHLIADLVRGAYLLPGESISLNEHVGERTRERGFVDGGSIRAGRLIPEVGGGVSQFATTIFNAAFFAGMDFETYQSHSLYFSRYPFGREATISSPAPDLVLANTTDYPILIWTSYDGTSITVSMYSTKHIEVSEVDQRTFARNRCTYVETDRQRTYPDGRVVVDTFEANYRPADGIDCFGNPIPRT